MIDDSPAEAEGCALSVLRVDVNDIVAHEEILERVSHPVFPLNCLGEAVEDIGELFCVVILHVEALLTVL